METTVLQSPSAPASALRDDVPVSAAAWDDQMMVEEENGSQQPLDIPADASMGVDVDAGMDGSSSVAGAEEAEMYDAEQQGDVDVEFEDAEQEGRQEQHDNANVEVQLEGVLGEGAYEHVEGEGGTTHLEKDLIASTAGQSEPILATDSTPVDTSALLSAGISTEPTQSALASEVLAHSEQGRHHNLADTTNVASHPQDPPALVEQAITQAAEVQEPTADGHHTATLQSASASNAAEGEHDEEEEHTDDMGGDSSPPPIRVTFATQSFVMFGDASSAYLGVDASVTTSEVPSRSASELQHITVPIPSPPLHVESSTFSLPLESLFAALRVKEVLGDFLEDESSELVLTMPDLDLLIREDDIYAREVTLEDLHRLHAGCGLQTSLHLDVSEAPRFINKYNALADFVAEQEAAIAEHGTPVPTLPVGFAAEDAHQEQLAIPVTSQASLPAEGTAEGEADDFTAVGEHGQDAVEESDDQAREYDEEVETGEFALEDDTEEAAEGKIGEGVVEVDEQGTEGEEDAAKDSNPPVAIAGLEDVEQQYPDGADEDADYGEDAEDAADEEEIVDYDEAIGEEGGVITNGIKDSHADRTQQGTTETEALVQAEQQPTEANDLEGADVDDLYNAPATPVTANVANVDASAQINAKRSHDDTLKDETLDELKGSGDDGESAKRARVD